MFPLGTRAQVEKKTQMPWNAALPYKDLGWRTVHSAGGIATPVERLLAKA